MNRVSQSQRCRVIAALVEGASINSTVRMTGVAKHTILKLLKDVDCARAEYHNRVVRNVNVRRAQCDEIWAFCYAKDKNVPAEKRGQFGYGDVWTWTVIDADSKLILSYIIGTRGSSTAHAFMHDLAGRVSKRIQLTTDGHRVYVDAVEGAFGSEIDYSMLVKLFGNDSSDIEARYSSASCIGCCEIPIIGGRDPQHVSTSFVERQNLTMRMSMRRFTRLTNGFSKKVENHGHAVAFHFFYYKFIRIHKTLRVTPAMEAGIAYHVWSFDELVALFDRSEKKVA